MCATYVISSNQCHLSAIYKICTLFTSFRLVVSVYSGSLVEV